MICCKEHRQWPSLLLLNMETLHRCTQSHQDSTHPFLTGLLHVCCNSLLRTPDRTPAARCCEPMLETSCNFLAGQQTALATYTLTDAACGHRSKLHRDLTAFIIRGVQFLAPSAWPLARPRPRPRSHTRRASARAAPPRQRPCQGGCRRCVSCLEFATQTDTGGVPGT